MAGRPRCGCARRWSATTRRSRCGRPRCGPIVKRRRATWAPTLLRGRGRPGAEAAERPHLGAARRPPVVAGPRRRRRPGQHRRGGMLPARGPAAPVYQPRVPAPQGRAEGVHLGRLPGPDHRRPPPAVSPAGLGAGITSTSTWPRNWRSSPQDEQGWLRVYRLPAYAPDMNPAEGIWSLLKRSHGQLRRRRPGRPGPHHQAQAEEIQYRPHLIDGCLAATGLRIEPW